MSRTEVDSLGKVEIPEDKYWGAQTQRSLENFAIGDDRFPEVFIKNYAILKKAAALANKKIGKLEAKQSELIAKACDEIIEGKLASHFPLKVWQTGSGTQTNMNLNEVISNRASELGGASIGDKLVHPNDHVNMGQSSNDTFPTVMQMSATEALKSAIPAIDALTESLDKKAEEFKGIVKIGRTHLMDAVPMTVGQEFSAWAKQLKDAKRTIEQAAASVRELPIGGTAIGTGLNASDEFTTEIILRLNELTGEEFSSCENKFVKIAAHDDLAALSSSLKIYALAFTKVANDVRLLGSGPRCGLAELLLPENEPGSSIMPGKVNPTQCEAVTMVCAQVVGNDAAISFGAASGQFQLNAYKPLIIHNLLHSIRLLTDASSSFEKNCVSGLQVNKKTVQSYLEGSLMLVTALAPKLGYETCSKIAQAAYRNGTTIKEEAVSKGLVTEKEFDEIVDAKKMI